MIRSLAVAFTAAALIGVTSTAVAQGDPEPPTSPSAEADTIRMELVDQSFDLAPNGTIDLTYRLIGDLDTVADLTPPTTTTTTTSTTTTTTTLVPPPAPLPLEPAPPTPLPSAPTTTLPPPPPPAELTVRVLNYRALDDPTELTGLLGPDPRFSRLPQIIDGVDVLDIRSMITVESPTEALLELSVPTDTDISISEKLEFNDDGIHPIVVQLRADDQVIARHGTVVERRSGSSATPPTVDLSLFAAIEDPGPTGTDEQYETAVEEFRGLVADADVLEASITMAIPPSVVTTSVDSGAVDGEDEELLADDALLAAPATPFDVSTAVAIGRVDAFVRQLRAGEDDVAAAIGKVPIRDIWSATSELSGPAAQVLRDLGVRYLAMPREVYLDTIADEADGEIPTTDRFIVLPLPDGGRMPVLIIDEEFGAAFETETTEEILAAATPAEWSIQTIAELRLEQYAATFSQRGDQRSRLIAVPGLGAFDPRLAVELERVAATTEAIRFSPANDLTSSTDTVTAGADPQLPDVAGPSLDTRLDRIAVVEASLATAASMLPEGDERPAEWARRLDSFVSTAFEDDEVNAELDQLLTDAQSIRDGVVAPEPFTFTLTGREGDIDIRVGNELDEPLNVVLRLSSPRLEFPEGDVSVTLAADEITVINVPVVARSNGTSAVTVEVLTPPPTSIALTDPVTLTSRVNALTGLGQVLTATFLLILLTWWLSHWRARRRENAGTDLDAVAAE